MAVVMNNGGFVGTIAISGSGHDKGECYVIVAVERDNFVLCVNGGNRPVSKPKRKNIRHLCITKSRAAVKSDLEIKRAVREFRKFDRKENLSE